MFVAEGEQAQSVVVHGRIHQVVVGLGDGRRGLERWPWWEKLIQKDYSKLRLRGM